MFAESNLPSCILQIASGSAVRSVLMTAALGLWVLPAPARADVLLFAVNTGEQSFTATDLADLNGSASGGTTLTFTTNQANQRVVITYDATCFIDPAPSNGEKWAVVTILVDPAGAVGYLSAPPTNALTNGGVLLCDASWGAKTAMRTSVVASVRPSIAGTHSIRVQVKPVAFQATPEVLLQATSLTVMR